MAYIDKTMFEITVSNSVRNQTQNVAGKLVTVSGSDLIATDGSAGLLCTRYSLLPSEGYEALKHKDASTGVETTYAINNGNTWNFVKAATGAVTGLSGDHTGIYAINNYDVNKATSGDNRWNLGANTLGLGLPAGERGTFTEIMINEQYTFGENNFSTLPTDLSATPYATIADGLYVAAAAAPAAGSGLYFQILRLKNVNEANGYVGKGYVLLALRA